MTTPVSGPGQFSKRTDTAVSNANNTLPNAQYGENRDYQEAKSAAPMAAGPEATPVNLSDLFNGAKRNVIPLNSPSAEPNTPVTDGAASGLGAGPEALAMSQPAPQANNDALKASLTALEWMANRPGSSDSARELVRKLKAQIG